MTSAGSDEDQKSQMAYRLRLQNAHCSCAQEHRYGGTRRMRHIKSKAEKDTGKFPSKESGAAISSECAILKKTEKDPIFKYPN